MKTMLTDRALRAMKPASPGTRIHCAHLDLPQPFVTHTVGSRRVGVVPRAGAPRGTAESFLCTSRGPTASLG